MERSAYPRSRAQAHGTSAHRRRHTPQRQRHTRPGALQRWGDSYPSRPSAEAALDDHADSSGRGRRDRPPARPPYRRRGRQNPQPKRRQVRSEPPIQHHDRDPHLRVVQAQGSLRALTRSQASDLAEIAKRLKVTKGTVKIWRRSGLLPAHAYSDRGDYLFEPPGPNAPVKGKHHRAKRLGRTTAYKQIVTPVNSSGAV